jgi:hypothetical protein
MFHVHIFPVLPWEFSVELIVHFFGYTMLAQWTILSQENWLVSVRFIYCYAAQII